MSGYVLGRDAEQDLNDLWDYIAEDSVEAADRLIAALFDAFEALARNSGIGHKRQDLTSSPVLFWPVGNYSSYIGPWEPWLRSSPLATGSGIFQPSCAGEEPTKRE